MKVVGENEVRIQLVSSTGPQGPVGPAGPKGDKGDRGETGPRGLTGETGPQGEKGETGATGATGATGQAGADGKDGQDGVSPTVTVEAIDGGHRVTITDANGTQSFDVMDGVDGQDGSSGEGGATIEIDDTLTQSGKAADAKVVGDKLTELNEAKANDADLAKVAKSGSYNDLSNKPTIPTVPESLKNPNKLILTGAVTAEYDGSSEVSVEIPAGGADGVYPVIVMTDATADLAPNTFYQWGEIDALTITLGAETEGVTNEYCFEFVSGNTATTLTVPDTIRWVQEPTIEAGRTYQVSILNQIGVIVGA